MSIVVGKRNNQSIGSHWKRHALNESARDLTDVFLSIKEETGIDPYMEPAKMVMDTQASETLKDYFVKDSAPDEEEMTAEEMEDHIEMMEEQFKNNVEAITEHATLAGYNPVMGLTFPVHKNLMMNNIFDKGSIQKAVAVEPKFTISMERRLLITPDGEEIDIAKDQHKIRKAMDDVAPFKEVVITLPENGETDILSGIGATRKDDLSIDTHISGVLIEVPEFDEDGNPTGTTKEEWVKVKMEFSPAYGENDRTLMSSFKYDLPDGTCIQDTVSANLKKNRMLINCFGGEIKAVKVNGRRDTSSGMNETPRAEWRMRTDIVEIPAANPINTTISPEEIKDIQALYKVDQLTKILSIFKDTLGDYKDSTIKRKLDESFLTMPETDKSHHLFDMAPVEGYALDYVEWRKKTFMDAFDTYVTDMLYVLRDPNMSVCVYGRPDLIRKIQPTQYVYKSPEKVGPVTLDYHKTVTTTDDRKYTFLSSQKLADSNQLIVLLRPENTDRIIYRIYDYQMLISNDIRNYANHTLPAVQAFERWKFVEYQPVQSRITIINPSGLRPDQMPDPNLKEDVILDD